MEIVYACQAFFIFFGASMLYNAAQKMRRREARLPKPR